MLATALHSKSGLIRKTAALGLRIPRWTRRLASTQLAPAAFVNSVPKSGTHLLEQIVRSLPGLTNYGSFLASMTSSFRYTLRSHEDTLREIYKIASGELIRGHLFFDPEFANAFVTRNVVHFFIYRDPRDLVVSESHYVSQMNRWHRLRPLFRQSADPISLAIQGIRSNTIDYPDIGTRFAKFAGWIRSPHVRAIRFEDLIGNDVPAHIEAIVRQYAKHTDYEFDVGQTIDAAIGNIDPRSSHTFRSGVSGKWRQEFTRAHVEQFKLVAGDLLVDLGYEADQNWHV